MRWPFIAGSQPTDERNEPATAGADNRAADLAPNRIEAFPGGAWVDERGSPLLSKLC